MKKLLVFLIIQLCVMGMLAESLTYQFSTLGDQKDVAVTKIETDAYTLEFDKGTSDTQPIYYKGYSRYVFFQPGNTMRVTAKGGAQIAKIVLRGKVSKTSFVPDVGNLIGGGYGYDSIWEIPGGHSSVLFTAFECPQSQEIGLYEIEVIYYGQPAISYCNSSEIKAGTSVNIFSSGAESLRVVRPDGSFEDLLCKETYPSNYARCIIDFPLQAEQTSIEVYPIQRNWHYTNLRTTITFTQIFDEHTSDDIKVGNLYYKINTDSEGLPYAEVRKDGRYRDLTEVTIPDFIQTADGVNINVKSIGQSAFRGCKYLNKITLPSTLNEVGTHAFCGCISLESIDIPESVTIIGGGAFANCKKIKAIKFPDNLKYFSLSSDYGSPIRGCESLTKVVLPNKAYGSDINWQYVTSSFLEGCNSVQEFIIPDNVNGLSDDFFKGNESIRTIKFGANFSQFPSSIRDLPYLTELVFDPANNNYKEVDGALYCNYNQYGGWLLVWLRELPKDGVLRLIDNSPGIDRGALKGYTLEEVIFPSTFKRTGYIGQLVGCRVEKLVLPGTLEFVGTAAFRSSNIGTLIIEEGDSPIIFDALDSNRETDGVFQSSNIDNLIINRDIDNVNNYGWPKPHTKAFYRSSIGTVTVNTSLGENACGILSGASVSTIILGPDVKRLYALGNHECDNLEIYSTDDIEAPFNINDGPLNTLKYTYNGLNARNIYVYPAVLDKYKSIYPKETVFPLFGTSSIQFNNVAKMLRPADTFSIDYITSPSNLNLEWTSSNAKAATVSEDGVVSAHADGATIITARCIDNGYEHLSQSMAIYVSENAELKPEEAYLTIKGLGNHSSRHCYKTGSTAVIDIIPEEGWMIHSISLNGEDISAAVVNNTVLTPELYGENEMNIVFKMDTGTGIAQIRDSNIRIVYGLNKITIEGIAQDAVIRIYDLSGRCIYEGTNHTISLKQNKCYLLRVNDTLFKFVL